MPEQPLNIESRLLVIEGKLDELLVSEQKRRKFAMWTLIVTVAVIVLPLIFLPFAINSFLQTLDLSSLGY